jgi:hypothetical protein
MAHYAFLDKNNIVTEVIVGVDETELIEGLDPETWYGNFKGQVCKRTSYNRNIRKNYAGIGYTYDEYWDAFIPPNLFPSWKLDYTTFQWVPPIAAPKGEEGFYHKWSEPNQMWIKIPLEDV